MRQSFTDFIFATNTDGSGKAASYVRALDMHGTKLWTMSCPGMPKAFGPASILPADLIYFSCPVWNGRVHEPDDGNRRRTKRKTGRGSALLCSQTRNE